MSSVACNRAECRITVDTSQLMVDKTYERQILLHTHSAIETYSLNVHVQTAAIPVAVRKPPYLPLSLLGRLSFCLVWVITQILPFLNSSPLIITVLMLLVLSGALSETVKGGVAEKIFKHFPPPPVGELPSSYQRDSLQGLLGLFLQAQGHPLPDYCQVKSASALSRFLVDF